MTNDQSTSPTKGLIAELALVGLLVVYGSFSVYRLILLLLLASQSLWVRGLDWSEVGLKRPAAMWRTLRQAVVAAVFTLVAVRMVIVPSAVWLAGVPVDLSAVGEAGDARALWIRLGQAWTLAALGEEMVFRGYLIRRLIRSCRRHDPWADRCGRDKQRPVRPRTQLSRVGRRDRNGSDRQHPGAALFCQPAESVGGYRVSCDRRYRSPIGHIR